MKVLSPYMPAGPQKQQEPLIGVGCNEDRRNRIGRSFETKQIEVYGMAE
jgi:hypothetical protein